MSRERREKQRFSDLERTVDRVMGNHVPDADAVCDFINRERDLAEEIFRAQLRTIGT